MKLLTYLHSNQVRSGALTSDGQHVIDLKTAFHERFGASASGASVESVQSIIEHGQNGLDCVATLVKDADAKSRNHLRKVSEVKLMAPVPIPVQMRDFLCFEKHLVQAFAQASKMVAKNQAPPEPGKEPQKAAFEVPEVWYKQPIFYKPNRFCISGHDDDVAWPPYSNVMDFELEFGCYIAKQGKDIRAEDAKPYIFGYTIFNDFSARDEQTKEMKGHLGPGKGKDFDASNSMGPFLVTADEIKNPYQLAMSVRVNGEEWGRGNTSEMYWKFEDLIAHISRSETLHAGEFFGSGTVGNGCGLEQGRYMKAGDTVELEVEGIGVLRNRVTRG